MNKLTGRVEKFKGLQLTVLNETAVLLDVYTGTMVTWYPVDDAGVKEGAAAALACIEAMVAIPSTYRDV